MIQKTIRNRFQECTVLTVAHRLRTIIDNDRILVGILRLTIEKFHFILFDSLKVLDRGHLIEFDRPEILLSNPNSQLTFLVEQTGPVEAEYLRNVALHSLVNK